MTNAGNSSPAAFSSGLVPLLKEQEIRNELERIYSKPRRSRLVALYGRGEECSLTAQGHPFDVIPTSCELEMRAAMPLPAENYSPGKVFLIDWTEEGLPLDLECRVAGARVHPVSKTTRLAGLFGARQIDPRLEGTALATMLLSTELPLKKISGQLLRHHDAYRRFLHARFQFPLEGELTLELLLPWCVQNNEGPSFVDQLRQKPYGEALLQELLSFVQGETDVFGALAWRAWEAGQGPRFLELCLVMEGIQPALQQNTYLEGLLRGRMPSLAPGWGEGLLSICDSFPPTELLDRVLLILLREHPQRCQMLLEEAEGLLEEAEFRRELAASRLLPCGYVARKEQLSALLLELAQAPSMSRLQEALALFDEWRTHRCNEYDRILLENDRRPYERNRLKQQMLLALRLATYRVWRSSSAPPPASGAPYQPMLDRAARYTEEGGYVDRAREALRELQDEVLGPSVQALLTQIDALRQEDDQCFAAGLDAWLQAGQPTHQVLPLQEVSRRLVADFLRERPTRKLLVVLIEGMTWRHAIELLDSLADEPDRWSPALWSPRGFPLQTPGILPPVFSLLPSLPSLNRAAFLSGKRANLPGPRTDGKDRQRWADNRSLRSFVPPEKTPPLFSSEGLIEEGQLASAVRDWLRLDEPHQTPLEEHPRVGLVLFDHLNALLESDSFAPLECTVNALQPLRDLLGEAAANEWAVLLLGTNGYVSGRGMESQGPRGEGGKRWRVLFPGEEAQDFECKLSSRAVWRPEEVEQIAAIWDSKKCYGLPGRGEYGGISLAEVVLPALLVAPETLAELRPGETDPGVKPAPISKPEWWQLHLPPATSPEQPPKTATTTRPARSSSPPPQLSLPMPAEAKPEDSPSASPSPSVPRQTTRRKSTPKKPEPPPLLQALQKSPVFKAHAKSYTEPRIDEALQHLTVLVQANDFMAEQEFARQCGVQPYRVSGLVARLGEVFNLDGYAVIEHDPGGHQVRLHRTMLQQLFEVKE